MGINKYSWKKNKSIPANLKKVNELAKHRTSSGDPMYFFDNGNYVIFSCFNKWFYTCKSDRRIRKGKGNYKHLWSYVGELYFDGTKWTYEGDEKAKILANYLITTNPFSFNHKHASILNESRTDDNK